MFEGRRERTLSLDLNSKNLFNEVSATTRRGTAAVRRAYSGPRVLPATSRAAVKRERERLAAWASEPPLD